uniref:NADH-ubiquinone oxidoreductase chain 2 n=1 Tax=Chondrodactylus laevigatus TaxID=130739 RepID=B1PHR2_9SAUR|nr:NADH dehydrogenase subunit 2 [Chondrodactylus laevigatus]
MNRMVFALLIPTLSTSTLLQMFSHHWLLAWLGLELNTMSILPVIMKTHTLEPTEAATKYFIIQLLAGALILFASTLNAWQSGQWNITASPSPVVSNIILAAIMLKMGIAPAHMWYPDVIQGTTMTTAAVISTWQKLAPLALLYLTINHMQTNTLLLMGITSALIGGWIGLNQTQTRKILAMSSIAHMGWLLTALAMNYNPQNPNIPLPFMMNNRRFPSPTHHNHKNLKDLGTAWSQSPTLMTFTSMTLLSMGGLPPLTGFMPKLLILKELITMKTPIVATILALASLPSLYFYTRMTYIATLTTPPSTLSNKYKWRLKTNRNHNPTMMTTMAIMLLPLTPLLYTPY